MNQAPQLTFKQALLATRVIWAGLLMGQLAFLTVIVVLWSTHNGPAASPDDSQLLFYVSLGALFTFIPAGYMARSQTYKRSWQSDVILPIGYLRGNLILLALCESVAILGLVATLLNGKFFPTIIPSVVALAVQAVNFPHGKPMHPAKNPYQQTDT